MQYVRLEIFAVFSNLQHAIYKLYTYNIFYELYCMYAYNTIPLLLFFIVMISTDCDSTPAAGTNISFGSANYIFIHPHNSSPSAIVGNMTLFIWLDYITELLGSVGSSGFALQFYFNSLGSLTIEGALGSFRLDDDAVLEVGTGRRQWRHDTSIINNYVIINSTDYNECSSENMTYLNIPIAFTLSKGPRTVGRRQWDIDLRSLALPNLSNENFPSNFTPTIVNVITHPIESKFPTIKFILKSIYLK